MLMSFGRKHPKIIGGQTATHNEGPTVALKVTLGAWCILQTSPATHRTHKQLPMPSAMHGLPSWADPPKASQRTSPSHKPRPHRGLGAQRLLNPHGIPGRQTTSARFTEDCKGYGGIVSGLSHVLGGTWGFNDSVAKLNCLS